ncbi:BatD family protein [Empedobacter falsenii]
MKNLLLLVSFFILNFSFAQEIMPKLDRTTIKVGEPIQYEIKIDFKKGDKIVFPTISDSLNYHIEVLDQKIDTVKTEVKSEIVQQLELTGFEAGKFTIPSFIIQKNDKDLTTKQLEIEIQDVEVDTTKNAIFPIKPVMEEEYSIRDYWNKYWLYGIIAFILFIIAAVLLILYIRAKSKLSGDKLYKTPYDEAKASLKALDAKKYLKRGEQKEYYTQLSFIVRRYLGRVYNFSALEILSDDLVKYIATKQDVLPDDVQKFKQFLFDADLVKFAKQEFDDSTNNMHRNWVDEFVERIKPIEIPENEDLNKDQVTGEKYKQFNNN